MAIKLKFSSGQFWQETSDRDPLVLNELERLTLRRYYHPSDADRLTRRNQRMLMRYLTGQGIMFWRRKEFLPGKTGIKCVLFVNNSERSSVELLQDAMELARSFWLESPFFAEINPKLFPPDAKKIFEQCGWKYHGKSNDGYPIYVSEAV